MSHWWEWLLGDFRFGSGNRKLGHVTYCLVFWCKGLLEILIGRSPWHNVSILSLLRPPYTNFGRGQKQWISPFLRGWVQMRTIQPWNMISHDSYLGRLWVIMRVWLIFRGWDTFKQAIRIWGTVCLDAKIKKIRPGSIKQGRWIICKEDYLSFAIGGRDGIFGREIMRSRNWMRSKATLKIATMMP